MNRTRVVTLALVAAAIAWAVWRRAPTDLPVQTSSDRMHPPVREPQPDMWRDSAGPLAFRTMELLFRYERGDSGAAWPVEPVGGGVGIADFDADGLNDLFFAQGVPLPVSSGVNSPADVLLRNRSGEQFEDVSAPAALVTQGYGMGVTIADCDSDGFPDVYVTRYGRNTLWHNLGDGQFRDITAESGVGCELWSLGAAFADFDEDGDLDLFVANYFDFDPAEAPFARDPVTGAADYGAPASFPGQPDVLYRNAGDGQFTDSTAAAGISDDDRGMGVLATDLDGDGHVDILVANDAQNNTLWHNRGDGKFEDMALSWGVAVNAEGQTEANMGIAYGDTDGDGLADILITHLVNEHDTLWRGARSASGLFFRDKTYEAGLGLDSRRLTGWGVAFADFDQDGMLDIVVANGHIRREANQPYVYENPPLLWHNHPAGRFSNVTDSAGPYFRSLHAARGLAAGDLDGDGDLDLVVVQHHEASVILWNESPPVGASVIVDLLGAVSNRDVIGARLEATCSGRALLRSLDGGGSYLSSSDRRVHFGLGPAFQVDNLEIRWPSGYRQLLRDLPVDQVVRVREEFQEP